MGLRAAMNSLASRTNKPAAPNRLLEECCDKLETLCRKASTFIAAAEIMTEYPDVRRVQQFAADNQIPYLDITTTAEFSRLKAAVATADAARVRQPNFRSTDAAWFDSYSQMATRVGELNVFLSLPETSERLYRAYELVEERSKAYRGPYIQAELTDMFDAYTNVVGAFAEPKVRGSRFGLLSQQL